MDEGTERERYVPKIDVDLVKSNLLSVKEALEHLRAAESAVLELIDKGRIVCHQIDSEKFVRNSELSR